MKRPKICFVSPLFHKLLTENLNLMYIGGAELQQFLIAKELIKRHYKVSVISTINSRSEIHRTLPFELIPIINYEKGIPILRFFYRRLVMLWHALLKSDADIYYVRSAGYKLAPVVFFAKKKKKKVVFCGAEDRDFDPKSNKISSFRDKMLFFWALKKCSRIVVQNEIQNKQLKKNFQIDGKVIHNGFSKKKYLSSMSGDIIWVATIKRKKNPDIFLELAERIPSEKFAMVGGSSSKNNLKKDKFYKHIAHKAHSISNLEFYGFQPFEQVEKRFMNAKLFINTSKHEGFPNTFLQAWSRGIPVISFIDPDNLISRYNLGIVVKDIDEMAQKINDFLEDKINFSYQGIKTYFDENLTIERAVDKYENIFKELTK